MTWFRRNREGPSEATEARKRAETQLDETRNDTPKYAALGERLRERREVNHLTELFLDVSRRPHP